MCARLPALQIELEDSHCYVEKMSCLRQQDKPKHNKNNNEHLYLTGASEAGTNSFMAVDLYLSPEILVAVP